VGAAEGVRVANFLCAGNYAISGGLAGCDAAERLAKSFKARAAPRPPRRRAAPAGAAAETPPHARYLRRLTGQLSGRSSISSVAVVSACRQGMPLEPDVHGWAGT